MTRRTHATSDVAPGRGDWSSDPALERLEVGSGDEALAILAEDGFDRSRSADVVRPEDPGAEWIAKARLRGERALRALTAWCVVTGDLLWLQSRRWWYRAGPWAADAVSVAAAWMVATAVTVGFGARSTWGALSERSSRLRAERRARATDRRARNATAAAVERNAVAPPATTARARAAAPPSLRDAALSAWGTQRDQQAAQEAEARRRRAARDANALRRLADARLGIKVAPKGGVVDVDGLKLGVVRGQRANDYALVLFSACPAGGERRHPRPGRPGRRGRGGQHAAQPVPGVPRPRRAVNRGPRCGPAG